MTDTYSSDSSDLGQMASLTQEQPSQRPLPDPAQTRAPQAPATFAERFPGPDAPFTQGGISALLPQLGPSARPATPPQEGKPPEPPPQPPAPQPRWVSHQPFINTKADPRAAAWGRDDPIMMAAGRSSGLMEGPHMPQPADYAGVIQRSGGMLSKIGSTFVSAPAAAMLGYSGEFWKAYRAGQLQNAHIHQMQFQEALKMAVFRQNQVSREYGELYAAYGPHTENGKFIPGDADALREGIQTIAAKYGDHSVEQVLLHSGPEAAARVIQHLDASNKDLGKILSQQSKQWDIRLKEQRYERELEKARVKQRALDQWKQRPGASDSGDTAPPVQPSDAPRVAPTAAGGSGGAGSAPAPDDDPNLARPADPDLNFPSREEARPPATPEEPLPPEERSDTTDTTETPDTDTTDTTDTTKTPDETSETPPSRTSVPDERTEAPAAPEAPEVAAAPAPPQPIRLAQADTGTATDAPRPGEATPPLREEPARKGDRSPVAKQPAAAPGAAPAAAAPATPPLGQLPGEWQPSPSILRGARFPDGDRVDEGQINAVAQGLANGTPLRDLKGMPGEVLDLAFARKAQIEGDMQRIMGDNTLRGEAVYRALDKVNPQFSASLRSYVEGSSAIPNTAGRNLGYIQRIIALGQKADPHFNAGSYKNRYNAVQTMIGGQLGRTVISILTADEHVNRLLANAEELQRTGAYATNDWLRGSALYNQGKQSYLTQIAPDWAGNPAAKVAINNYRATVRLIAPEIARAQKGAAPTLAEIKDVEDSLNSKNDLASLRASIATARGLFHDRMNKIGAQWERMSGGHTQQDMDNLFTNFSRGHFSEPPADPRTHEKTVQPDPIDLPGGMTYGQALQRFRQSPATAPESPAAPAGGAPAATPGHSDDDARRWLQNNPNSPFADRVRRQLEGR